jgi:hypothetical protein
MNTKLFRTLAGPSATTLADAVAAGSGAVRCLRMDPAKVDDQATQIKAHTDDMATPGLPAPERTRLGKIDAEAELARARGNARALAVEQALVGATPYTAADIDEVADHYEAADLAHKGASQLQVACTDSRLVVVGVFSYIDRVIREDVTKTLAGPDLSDDAKLDLLREFAPRLGLLFGEQQDQAARRAYIKKVLGPLLKDAEKTEEAAEALRVFAAAHAGEPVSLQDAIKALEWQRRRDEENDSLEAALLSRRTTER